LLRSSCGVRSFHRRANFLLRRDFRFSRRPPVVVALLLEPVLDIGAVVAHVSANAEAARSGAEVAPLAQGGGQDAQQLGYFGEGDQFIGVVVAIVVAVAGVGGGSWASPSDAVADRLDALGRAVGVAYSLPTADVVDLVPARK
jgi:hypothetical protein